MPEPDEEGTEEAARLKALRKERILLVMKIRRQCLLSRGERARAEQRGHIARVLVWSKGWE